MDFKKQETMTLFKLLNIIPGHCSRCNVNQGFGDREMEYDLLYSL